MRLVDAFYLANRPPLPSSQVEREVRRNKAICQQTINWDGKHNRKDHSLAGYSIPPTTPLLFTLGEVWHACGRAIWGLSGGRELAKGWIEGDGGFTCMQAEMGASLSWTCADWAEINPFLYVDPHWWLTWERQIYILLPAGSLAGPEKVSSMDGRLTR